MKILKKVFILIVVLIMTTGIGMISNQSLAESKKTTTSSSRASTSRKKNLQNAIKSEINYVNKSKLSKKDKTAYINKIKKCKSESAVKKVHTEINNKLSKQKNTKTTTTKNTINKKTKKTTTKNTKTTPNKKTTSQNTKKTQTTTTKNTTNQNKKTTPTKTELERLLDENKEKHKELNAGDGMHILNRSPSVSFNDLKNGKIKVTFEDGKGFQSISEKLVSTGKVNKLSVPSTEKTFSKTIKAPAKNKVKKMSYTVKDVYGLTSIVKLNAKNKNNKNTLDVSMRVSFSYSDGNLNLILRDNGGINKDNASVEVIDKNANKSFRKGFIKK